MNREQIRQSVTAQFFRSLGESEVEITTIPQKELEAVVTALADSVFAVLEELTDEDDLPAAARARLPDGTPAPDNEESFLWRGRPYLTIGTRYELTTQRLRIVRGVLSKRLEEIELVRVRDTKVDQNPAERALNIGDVTILSNDPSTPSITLNNVPKPIEVRELIRTATIDEKERRGLHYREEM